MAFADPKFIVGQCTLKTGMEVADFGAGAGYLAIEVAECVGKEGRVYVIDIQQELLTKATHLAKEHHLESLVFLHGDLEAPRGSTLGDASVDFVCMVNVLFQIEDKSAVMREAYRILRPNGRALVVDWLESFGGIGPQPEHVFGADSAQAIAHGVGFVRDRDIDAGKYHYGMIFHHGL